MQRLDLFGLEATTIDWDVYREDAQAPLRARDLKQLRPHQQNALDDVMNGFEVHDRGKLIMACGTGKTLTALRIAERVAGAGGRVLFAAPSVSLVGQALRDWTQDAELPVPRLCCLLVGVRCAADVIRGRGPDLDPGRRWRWWRESRGRPPRRRLRPTGSVRSQGSPA